MFAAGCVAAAALDPHDVSVEGLTIRAVETEAHGTGQRGRAAAVIAAGPAGTRAVPLRCGAASEGDADRFLLADGSLTFLTLLDDTDADSISQSELTFKYTNFSTLVASPRTLTATGSWWSHSRTWHNLVSLSSRQSGLSLVTRLDTPIPHVVEHSVHLVVCGKQLDSTNTSDTGNDITSAGEGLKS